MASELILVRRRPNQGFVEDMAHLFQGHRREWVPRWSRRQTARPKRLSCQRVRGCAKCSFVGADESKRTVRDVELTESREIFQKVYGPIVEILAIDLLKGDYTAALQGEGGVIFSRSTADLHSLEALML